MAKTCEELFQGIDATILGNPDEPVVGLAYRSDMVHPGDAFFCIVGFTVDGHSFAQDAIDRGAKVIVAERKLYLADATDVTVVVVSDSRRAMAEAACSFYDNPSASFQLVGITGTNGKTTTSYLVEAIAREAGLKTGVIGTVGMRVGDTQLGTEHTTPESPDLQRAFAQMRDAGCEVVAIEVSSHALDLERVWGSRFAVTAFTNLTQDHLDYHHTFDAYFEAKALLFGKDYPAKRVIGVGTQWGAELVERCLRVGDEVLLTGFEEDADIHPTAVDYGINGTQVRLDVLGEAQEFAYELVGKFNVENIMSAYAIGLELGIAEDVIIAALSKAHSVAGRLEQVGQDLGEAYSVYVDYAHTPDALTKAIRSVKELGRGRTIVVFGCGGDRDREKRPIMGSASLEADVAIVTSDNPRSEDPMAIIDDIMAGIRQVSQQANAGESLPAEDACEVIPDRREAICRAIDLAEPGDIVLIAGKGHEDYQIIGSEKTHFDDREEALAAMQGRRARG